MKVAALVEAALWVPLPGAAMLEVSSHSRSTRGDAHMKCVRDEMDGWKGVVGKQDVVLLDTFHSAVATMDKALAGKPAK